MAPAGQRAQPTGGAAEAGRPLGRMGMGRASQPLLGQPRVSPGPKLAWESEASARGDLGADLV